jgi:glycosyltransferase involved in cell wall biosynthesis
MGAIKKKNSVAMATYNGEKYILKQLQSIYDQIEKPFEVIISDDGSNDNTVEIVQRFIKDHNLSNWRLLCNKGEHGASNNFVNAMNHCEGDIIFLCDQDDIWLPNKIKEISSLFDEGYSCVVSSIKYIDSKDGFLPIKTAFTSTKNHVVTLNELLAVCSYLGMTAAFRRDVFKNVDSRFLQSTSHDWALFIEALHEGKVFFYGNVLQYHRLHADNTSGIYGQTAAEKRINLIERQLKHIQPMQNLPWISEEQRKTCKGYARFLKKRIGWIRQHKVLQIITGVGEYRTKKYTMRNILADLKSSF